MRGLGMPQPQFHSEQRWRALIGMRPGSPARRFGRTVALVACVILLVGIFVADTLTRYEIAIAAFYTAVILAMSRILSRQEIIALGCVCASLTVVSFLFSAGGAYETGIVNSSISLVVICITTYLVVAIDLARAEAQRANEHLIRLARIQSMHGLTVSIAHEISQPLAAILTSAAACGRWLLHAPPQIERAGIAVDRILADATRATEIIERVRRLTRGDPPQFSSFDINEAISETLVASRTGLEVRGITVLRELRSGLPQVWADRVQVQQVLTNLLVNATESLAAVPATKRRICISTESSDDGICCSVADSGPGIPPDVRPHLFEAFWTTKAEGIGVGLSLSRVLIEANGGSIWATDDESLGAVFRFLLPVAKGPNGQ